jgi:NTP pyrophosphatase (non-canonical NTP hydrolase)
MPYTNSITVENYMNTVVKGFLFPNSDPESILEHLKEEVEEVGKEIDKAIMFGEPRLEELTDELGDTLFCLLALITRLEIPISDIMSHNWAKLEWRELNGKTT